MKKMYCKHCGNVAVPDSIRRGSGAIEVILWIGGLFFGFFTVFISFAIPLIYTIWRSAGAYLSCPKCQTANPIPLDSPIAQSATEVRGSITDDTEEMRKLTDEECAPGDPSKYLRKA